MTWWDTTYCYIVSVETKRDDSPWSHALLQINAMYPYGNK